MNEPAIPFPGGVDIKRSRYGSDVKGASHRFATLALYIRTVLRHNPSLPPGVDFLSLMPTLFYWNMTEKYHHLLEDGLVPLVLSLALSIIDSISNSS